MNAFDAAHRIPSLGFRKILLKSGWRGTAEQEQAALRLLIPLSFLVYLFASDGIQSSTNDAVRIGIIFISTFLSIACALFILSLILSAPSQLLRMIGMVVDIGALSIGLAITGETGAPWYGVYLWVTLGNGFRYGEKYLYISMTISIIGFTYATMHNDYWSAHSSLAIGLIITLFGIPAYSSILIRRLNEARNRADAASRAKSDFLSCMSHEIRTPLNGILGMTDLLRLRPFSAEDKDCIETIHASGHALARQINEILDLSKIEAGKMSLEKVDFDLHNLVNMTLRIFVTQADEKGLNIKQDIDPSVPFLLQGDSHKLRQIITNLVGNALKFTTRGGITLGITRIRSDDGQTRLRFEIIDTGTGIPEHRLQAIFDPFTQASDSVTRNYGGTGLGTTICKNLVELMGGNIGVESKLGEGSTFWFEIPLRSASSLSADASRRWISGCHIAYITATEPSTDPVANELHKQGFPVATFTPAGDICAEMDADDYQAFIYNGISDDDFSEMFTGKDTRSAVAQTIIINQRHTETPFTNPDDSACILNDPLIDNRLLNVLHGIFALHAPDDDLTGYENRADTGTQIQRRLNVLVSDDNATNRVVMKRMLEKLGHGHTIVDGGEAALHTLESGQFDAVIIDKNMPDMGGIEVYQAYCFANSGKSPVEFAILTADATEEARQSCTAVGIRHFLTKPVSLARLEEVLDEMCPADMASGSESLPAKSKQATEPEDHAANLDFNDTEFAKLGELSGDDPEFIGGIVENFISDTNENICAIEAAVARGDWLKYRDLAHALKGSSLYLGLARLATLAKIAQDISADDFRNKGVANVVELRKAADQAFAILQDKLEQLAGNKLAS